MGGCLLLSQILHKRFFSSLMMKGFKNYGRDLSTGLYSYFASWYGWQWINNYKLILCR